MSNRITKFRAWHPGLNCMSEVLELDFQHNAIRCVPGHLPKNKLSDVALMQFTGLLDKNGKEIYEWDILNNGVVEFKYGKWLIVNKLDDMKTKSLYDCIHDTEVVEVIGNIYENPNLLAL